MRESNNSGSVEETGNLRHIPDGGRTPRPGRDGRSDDWGASGVAAMILARPARKDSDWSGNWSDGWDASGVGAIPYAKTPRESKSTRRAA